MKQLIAPLFITVLLTACGSGAVSTTERHVKGDANATLRIEEYADLQCPACRAAHTNIVEPLLEKYGNSIAYELYHFPLQQAHPYALKAAIAAECAGQQGQFYEYVDVVFENQSDLNADILPTWAEELGLNVDTFEDCQGDSAMKDIVKGDYERGRGLGVSGTPSFFVNGVKVERNNLDVISQAIDEALGLNIPL
jgi:protein-disulfide isomerase